MSVFRQGAAWIAIVIASLGIAFGAWSQDGGKGAVVQSIPPPLQEPTIPPLNLSDSQRAAIQQALRSENTEVSFALKSAKPSEKFNPSVDATIPKGLSPHPFPRPLVYQMPQLKQYTYLKFKGEVLIINAFTKRIVSMFPES